MIAFDRFERLLPAALNELADPQTPDYLADVLDRTAETRQRHAWASTERWLPMSAPMTGRIGAVAVIVAAIILGAVGLAVVAGDRNDGPQPSDAPSASAAAVIPSTPPSAEPSSATVPLPEPLIETWVAEIGTIDGLEADPQVDLVVAPLGQRAWLVTNDFGNEKMHSAPIEVGGDGFTLVSTEDGGGCTTGDVGRYTYSVAEDGASMTLATDDDACATRAAALSRTWHRSLEARTDGGRGVAAAFEPAIAVTLPDGSFAAGDWNRDAIDVYSPTTDEGLFVMKDPWGFSEPCEQGGGRPAAIDPGVDAVVAYLSGLPGFEVATEDDEVDGYRSVHATVTAGPASCPGETMALSSKNVTSGIVYGLRPGDSVSLHLIESPDGVLLVEVYGTGPMASNEAAVIDSIEFLDLGTPTQP